MTEHKEKRNNNRTMDYILLGAVFLLLVVTGLQTVQAVSASGGFHIGRASVPQQTYTQQPAQDTSQGAPVPSGYPRQVGGC